MKRQTILKSVLCLLVAIACLPMAMQAKVEHLLPKVHSLTETGGTPFALQRAVTIDDETNSTALRKVFTDYGCTIGQGGATVTVQMVNEITGAYDYTLEGYDNEGYQLIVESNAITIKAVKPIGVIRAAQTLAQLAEGYDENAAAVETVEITDWAAFKLRGYMHDVGRSFISVEELKKHIDLLSRFKVNTFHWHFTENQAWRFEVEGYPQLTADTSMTRFAGQYYTQAQCREVAAYAHERGVTIIPEIDMPGHSQAFKTAMGFSMQTDEGVEVLKKVLTQVADVFPNAPYIHIGADEEQIEYPNFLGIMADHIHGLGRKMIVWNPIRGVAINSTMCDMTQMWSSSGANINGVPDIDCRYNYTNHFDVFADVVGIYKSNIYYADKGSDEIAGTISAYWNDRKTPTEEDIVKQNNMYANVIASAERAWIGSKVNGAEGYIEKLGTTLPNSGEVYEEFKSWEERFLFHKAHSLKGQPIPYVKQTNVRWRITDPFPNGGDLASTFAPDAYATTTIATDGALIPETFTHEGKTYYTGMATGAGIYLRHTWGNNIIPTYYGSTNHNNSTAYAWTYVYSETEQEVGAQIEFQNYGRSEKDGVPSNGKWDHYGSQIWINGVEVTAPNYKNAGKSINNEVDLLDENFTAREPIAVTLNAGWNKVFIKLPYKQANYRLPKWMFTCVFTTLDGVDAVDGLIYSPNQCKDEATEVVAAKISELKRDRGNLVGTTIGSWDASLATALDAKIAEIEATYSVNKTAEERAAQVAELENAWTTFTTSLTTENMNKPVSGNYYRMYTPLRDSRYVTGNGAGNAATGETTATTKASIWKFVTRGDGSYDIINLADGTYISPASGNNSALNCVAQQPTAGWSVKQAATNGKVLITSTSNNVQFNQTGSGQSYKLYNWGYNSTGFSNAYNTTDTGCQFELIDVTASLPPQPLVKLEGLGRETYPYAVDATLAAKVFAQEAITIAVDVTMPASLAANTRYALVCAADPTKAATGATKTNSPYVAYGLNGSNPAYLPSSSSGDKFTYRDFSFTGNTNYKVVYVIDRTNKKFYIYVDGALKSSADYPVSGYELQSFSNFASNVNAKLYIGGGIVSNTTSYDVFGGQVRSVLFFDGALDAAKIAEIEYPINAEDLILSDAVAANNNMNIFGLQRYLGLVQDGGDGIEGNGQFVCNYPAATSQESGNAYANLIDGNYTTFFHSGYGNTIGSGSHYLQADLGEAVKNFRLYFKKRSQNNNNRPTKITIEGSNDKSAWAEVKVISSGFPTDANVLDYYSEEIASTTAYQYYRFTVNTTNNSTVFYTFSEFYIFPSEYTRVKETFDAVRAYRAGATVETATALNAVYAWNKGLTEGSPIVGVESYIYADTYKDGAFLNRYLYNNNGTLTLTTEQSGADSFVWTPAVTEDGKYNFKNKVGKYLAHKGMSDNAHNFTVAATTHHMGVTLHSASGNYWVIKNADGGFDQSSVTYDQTNGNFCTDFVFIPTNLYERTFEPVVLKSAEEFENGGVYTFVTTRGQMGATESSANAISTARTSVADTDTDYFKWTVYKSNNGNYYLYNLGKKMFMGVQSANNTEIAFVETPAGRTLTFKQSSSAEYPIMLSTDNAGVVNHSTNHGGGLVNWTGGWNTLNDAGSNHKVTLVSRLPEATLQEIAAIVENYDQSLPIKVEVEGWTANNPNTHFGNVTATTGANVSSTKLLIAHMAGGSMAYSSIGDVVTFTRAYRGFEFQGFYVGEQSLGKSFELTEAVRASITEETPLVAKFTTTDDVTIWYDDDPFSYRIPAIGKTSTGRLIAVSDYRYSLDDIGRYNFGTANPGIDLVIRMSDDNGKTWGETKTIAKGSCERHTNDCAYGDAAIAVVGEKVLVMGAAGDVMFGNGSATAHNRTVRIFSEDNGVTWKAPEDISETLFIGDDATIKNGYSLFFGSGKLAVDENYNNTGNARIYGALLVRKEGYGNGIYAVYTDDFGLNWSILGGSQTPVTTNDEPKVEILPSGQILLSVRRGGGRQFNVFTYTDKATNAGSWNTNVNGCNNGGSNTCNGEIYLVDAKKADGTAVKLLLQSQPKGGGGLYDRRDVTIWYKEVDNTNYTSSQIASDWTQGFQVSTQLSAYSTMTLQEDGKIAFFFEEAPCYGDDYAKGYSMVYTPLTIESITMGHYFSPDTDLTTERTISVVLTDAQGNEYRDQVQSGLTGVAEALTTKYPFITIGDNANLETDGETFTYTNTVTLPFKVSNEETTVWHNMYIPSNTNARYPVYFYAESNANTTVKTKATSEEYGASDYNTQEHADKMSWAIYNVDNGFAFTFKNKLTGKYIKVAQPASSKSENVQYDTKENATAFSIEKNTSYRGDYIIKHETGHLSVYGAGDGYLTFFSGNYHWGSTVKIAEAPDFDALIAEVNATLGMIGDKLGQYTATEANVAVAAEAKVAMENSATVKFNTLNRYKGLIEGATLNMPQNGQYMRVAYDYGGNAGKLYMQSTASSVKGLEFTEATDAASIWVYYDGALYSYTAGQCLRETGNDRGLQAVGGETTATFAASTRAKGKYNLQCGSWVHANTGSGKYYTDHCSGNSCAQHDLIFESVDELPVSITSTLGFSTLFATSALALPEGVKAYTGALSEEAEGYVLTLTAVEGVIPARTGVILQGAATNYMFDITISNDAEVGDLKGSAATIVRGDATNLYTLQSHAGSSNGVAFKQYTGNNITGSKVYLELSTTQNAAAVRIRFGKQEGTTDIEFSTLNSQPTNQIFDLTGRCVENLIKGIYIVNGKKVMIR